MAGHSKWANIKRKKWAQDAKRSKLFTRLVREVMVAAKLGDPDPEANPRLRNAVDEALANNVPKDRVQRAIQRGAGELESEALEEARYEGYGPGGVAIMVDCLTDNRNRTAGDVRYVFNRYGGKLGVDGCVAFMFQHTGYLQFNLAEDQQSLMESAIEQGANDVIEDEQGTIEVYTDPDVCYQFKDALKRDGYEPLTTKVTMVPTIEAGVDDESIAESLLNLFDHLDKLNDVQTIYSNVKFDQDLMKKLNG